VGQGGIVGLSGATARPAGESPVTRSADSQSRAVAAPEPSPSPTYPRKRRIRRNMRNAARVRATRCEDGTPGAGTATSGVRRRTYNQPGNISTLSIPVYPLRVCARISVCYPPSDENRILRSDGFDERKVSEGNGCSFAPELDRISNGRGVRTSPKEDLTNRNTAHGCCGIVPFGNGQWCCQFGN
jgi:hypothetical protein